MRDKLDAVIIGAGHNGLVTAAYLARAGWKVLVVERSALLGGCAVTEEVWPGYRVSSGAYLVSLLQERIVRELELARHGYQVDAKDPPFFSPFPDGRHLFMWQDPDRTLAEIAKFSRRDAEMFPLYERHLEEIASTIERLLLEAPPPFPPSGIGDLLDYWKFAGPLRKLGAAQASGLVKVFTQSAADFLDEWFESEQVKVTLATDGVIGANGGPRSAGTAYILLHHCMGGVGGRRGVWGFVRGGMGSVSAAIAAAAQSRGARIRTNAPVARIQVRGGRAVGVVLENEEEIEARVVASSADPKVTFLRLLGEAVLPGDFANAIRRYRVEGTSCKINLALNGFPDFRCLPGANGPQHRATMHICPDVDYIERAWDDAKYGKPSRAPLLEMTMPTVYDPSLAPPGKHVMGIFLQYAPYTLRGTTWEAEREAFVNRVLSLIAEYAPNFPSLIEHIDVLTPPELERRFGITGGNIFHGEMSLDQMFIARPVMGWSRYRTPVAGLYLCGSGAHPGGGVMGAPGYNAARAILDDSR